MGFREVMRVFWPYFVIYIIVSASIIAAMIYNIHRNPHNVGWLGLLALACTFVWVRLVMRRGNRYWNNLDG
jgi:hypothetical protein